jgi:hypothetical protein
VKVYKPIEVKRTRLCSHCKEEFTLDKLERYGYYYFCKECRNLVIKAYSKPKDRLGIVEPKTEEGKGSYATYSSEGIRFINYLSIDEDLTNILKSISHEVLHWIIDKLEGIKASYDWDRIAYPNTSNIPIAYGIFLEGEDW